MPDTDLEEQEPSAGKPSLLSTLAAIWRTRSARPTLRFLQQAGIYGLGRGLTRLSSLILLPVYLVYLKPEDLGIISVATMVSPILASIWSLGLGQAVLRFYYEYGPEARRDYMATLWTFNRLLSVAGLVVLLLIGPTLSPYVISQVAYHPYVELAIWTAFFQAFHDIPMAVMRVREEAHLYVGINLASFLVNTGATIYWVVYAQQGALGSLKGNVVGSVFAAVIYIAYMLRHARWRIQRSYLVESVRYVLPMLPESLLSGVLSVADRFFLDKWVPLGVIGQYSIAMSIGGAVREVAQSFKAAFVPAAVRNWLEKPSDPSGIGRMSLLMLGVVGLASAGASLLAQEVLRIFGQGRYVAAIPMVPLAVLPALLWAVYFVVYLSFAFSKETKPLTIVFFLQLAGTIGLLALLVPRIGAWGALVATLGGMVVKVGVSAWFGHRVMPLSLPWRRLGLLMLASLAVISLSALDWRHPAIRFGVAAEAAILLLYTLFVAAVCLPQRYLAALWSRVAGARPSE